MAVIKNVYFISSLRYIACFHRGLAQKKTPQEEIWSDQTILRPNTNCQNER